MLQQGPASLAELLSLQLSMPHKNYYVLALIHSRSQFPTPQILIPLRQLINQDQRWLQVAKRLTEQDIKAFEVVVQAFINDFVVYRVFINMAFLHHQQVVIDRIQMTILSRMKVGMQIDVSEVVLLETLQMFLQEGLNSSMELYIPFFSDDSSQYLSQHLVTNKHTVTCLTTLTQKYIQHEKKNILVSSFQSKYPDFNALLRNVFALSLSNPPTVQTLELLSLLSQKCSIYPLFLQNATALLEICENTLFEFNTLMNQKFQNEAEEMINYENDVIQGQKSQTIYTQAGKLLQSLLQNIDGMLVSFFDRTLSLLQQTFKANDPVQNRQKLELLYLELILSANELKKRSDLLQRLTQFLGDCSEHIFVLHPSTPILNSRLIKLIQQFIHHLPSMSFDNTISFLFRCTEQPVDGLVIRVYQTLQTLVNQADLYSMLKPSMIALSSRLIHSISKAPSEYHFILLGDCLKHFDDLSERYCVKLLAEFTSRLNIEVKRCYQNNAKTSQIIGQIYKCIKTIISKPHILDDLYDEIEPILNEHAVYLQNPSKIDFEERILQLAAIVIQKGKQITPFVMLCLKSVMGIYNKNKDLDAFFELFYALCHDATNSMLGEPQSVEFIVNLVIKFFKEEADEGMMYTPVYQRACVILQLVVQYFQPLFCEGELRQRTVQQLLAILRSLQVMPTAQYINILVCLYYITPFDLQLPRQCFQLRDLYTNKLRSLYLLARLKFQYSEENLYQLLDYLEKYIDFYLLKSNKVETETTDEQKYLETLEIPFRQINDIRMIQEAIRELKQKKLIDIIQLSQAQRNTLTTVMKIDWCGKQMRRIHKFISHQ